MKLQLLRLALLTFVALGTASAASTVVATLAHPDQNALPGDTLDFYATFKNPGLDIVYLNAVSPNFSGPLSSFSLNDLFFANAPVFLAAGEESASILLFQVVVSSNYVDQYTQYAGSYPILGGLDGDSQDILASPEFSVTVASPTPEPATWLLCGATCLTMVTRRLKRRTGSMV